MYTYYYYCQYFNWFVRRYVAAAAALAAVPTGIFAAWLLAYTDEIVRSIAIHVEITFGFRLAAVRSSGTKVNRNRARFGVSAMAFSAFAAYDGVPLYPTLEQNAATSRGSSPCVCTIRCAIEGRAASRLSSATEVSRRCSASRRASGSANRAASVTYRQCDRSAWGGGGANPTAGADAGASLQDGGGAGAADDGDDAEENDPAAGGDAERVEEEEDVDELEDAPLVLVPLDASVEETAAAAVAASSALCLHSLSRTAEIVEM